MFGPIININNKIAYFICIGKDIMWFATFSVLMLPFTIIIFLLFKRNVFVDFFIAFNMISLAIFVHFIIVGARRWEKNSREILGRDGVNDDE